MPFFLHLIGAYVFVSNVEWLLISEIYIIHGGNLLSKIYVYALTS